MYTHKSVNIEGLLGSIFIRGLIISTRKINYQSFDHDLRIHNTVKKIIIDIQIIFSDEI